MFLQHWHGFFQKGTNWADGGAFVNQCPIASGHSFLYDFRAVDQAGKSARPGSTGECMYLTVTVSQPMQGRSGTTATFRPSTATGCAAHLSCTTLTTRTSGCTMSTMVSTHGGASVPPAKSSLTRTTLAHNLLRPQTRL